ncbi:MAG: 4-(cytidine 5'-diphospho)-2-C-methyl-D-erythritol kinase [Candidatus Limnocylindria bacterium]
MRHGLRLQAPAKLNLRLAVTGRRTDGLHLLDSDFVLLHLADELELAPGHGELTVEGRHAGALSNGSDNLAWRGLQAGLGEGWQAVNLRLRKRIPLAAGLGGGSSDAAVAWHLGRAWPEGRNVAPDDGAVAELATIGADVPFFAARVAAARVRGVGEQIEPIDAPHHEVVLVHPPFGLSTRDVFSELRPDEWGRLENDLLAPARRLRPELDDLFDVVRRAGGEPKLTGSGSTIFIIADDAEHAAALGRRLVDAGLRVTVTRTRDTAASIERINEED